MIIATAFLAGAAGRWPPPVLPAAVAPPNPGGVPPAVTLAGPHPQRQLADWAEQRSALLNIPAVALQAYAYAQEWAADQLPDCHLGWTTLAGIGSIESRHGRMGGSHLEADGKTSVPIRGIPLDGRNGTKAIPDAHDETGYARAMGPLQFIPATWQQYGTDGDNDGTIDPDNINDAAVTAAKYLCAGHRDLATAEGWWKAILSYNQSRKYGQDVLDVAARYARLSNAYTSR